MPRILDFSHLHAALPPKNYSTRLPILPASLTLQLHVVASYLKATRLFVGELLADEMFWWQNDRKTNRLFLRRFFTDLPVCLLQSTVLIELPSTQATECKIQFVSCPFPNSHVFFTQFNLTCLQCFFQVKVANKRKFCKCLYVRRFHGSWNILMKLSFQFFLNLFFKVFKGAN